MSRTTAIYPGKSEWCVGVKKIAVVALTIFLMCKPVSAMDIASGNFFLPECERWVDANSKVDVGAGMCMGIVQTLVFL